MKRRISCFLTSVLLLVIAPISDTKSFAQEQSQPIGSEASLIGKKWKLIEANGATVNSGRPYIQFGPKVEKYSGNDGCNGFAGDYRTDGSHIRFSPPARTMIGCLDSEVAKVEDDFLKGLDETTDFEIQGDILRLLKGGHSVLVFKASSKATADSR